MNLEGRSPFIEDIPIEDIIAEAKERYHIFFIIPIDASGGTDPEVENTWVGLLGQEYVIKLENPESISDKIATTVKAKEGKISRTKTKAKRPDASGKTSKKKPGRI